MKHVSPQLFKEQIEHIGEKQARIVLDNFIPVEQTLRYALRYNILNFSMVVKVKKLNLFSKIHIP